MTCFFKTTFGATFPQLGRPLDGMLTRVSHKNENAQILLPHLAGTSILTFILKSFFAFFLTLIAVSGWSQCIVINEIMVNGGGSSDGSNSPNTEEWVELYNTCTTPVNIGCMVISDGEFTVTIPSGTMLAANSFYTIGSSASGFGVDLNWSTCGCTTGGS